MRDCGVPLNQGVSVYEVELKMTNKNTRETSLVTRTEYAYHAMDALMQAVTNQAAAIGTGSADIEVVQIGPPAETIRKATHGMADSVAKLAQSIGRREAAVGTVNP